MRKIMPHATVAIKVSRSQHQIEADALSERLAHLVHEPAPFNLEFTEQQLQLRLNTPDAPGPIYVDFVGGKVAHRRQFGGGRGQPIAKAVGLKPGINPHIVDATAGLGRDSFLFASLGCRVTMVEQSPVIAALLEDGLQRGLADKQITEICQHIILVNADSADYLQRCTDKPDVIYLDPMYPHREKSALVKKEMRLFQLLLGELPNNSALFAAALGCAKKRVVVKRPKGAETITTQSPTMSICSKNTRYDVYVMAALPPR